MKSISIPSQYVWLCEEWHGGQDTMFYAISSTGALSLGTHSRVFGERPSDEVLMYGLIESTILEIENCIRIIEDRKGNQEEGFDMVDEEDLSLFEELLSYLEIKKVELEKTVLGILV